MNYQRFGSQYVLRLDPGDEVMETLERFVEREAVRGGYFQAVGAFRRARLRYLNMKTKKYEDNTFDQQLEVISLLGNVAVEPDGSRKVHMHAAVGDEDGRTYSGHVGEAVVTPTLEVFLTVLDGELRREKSDETGMSALALDRSLGDAGATGDAGGRAATTRRAA
jgi:predicted DNA-binding protein with PD1-like motif